MTSQDWKEFAEVIFEYQQEVESANGIKNVPLQHLKNCVRRYAKKLEEKEQTQQKQEVPKSIDLSTAKNGDRFRWIDCGGRSGTCTMVSSAFRDSWVKTVSMKPDNSWVSAKSVFIDTDEPRQFKMNGVSFVGDLTIVEKLPPKEKTKDEKRIETSNKIEEFVNRLPEQWSEELIKEKLVENGKVFFYGLAYSHSWRLAIYPSSEKPGQIYLARSDIQNYFNPDSNEDMKKLNILVNDFFEVCNFIDWDFKG